ncbi:MAG: DUF1846 family protein, partial [Hyphomicrobiaceae bacterium]|nr:DUF1846 family protein [Hyphomicrobiaceae bacterium]
AGFAIVNDEVAARAGRQEILRRYFRYACECAMGLTDEDTVHRVETLMEEFGDRPQDRLVVMPAREAAEAARWRADKGNKGVFVGAALQLGDGQIVTGTNSGLMHAAPSVILNAGKRLADIPKRLELLSENIIASIGDLKKNVLGRRSISLDLEETLIALSISSTTNPTAHLAMDQLKQLAGCEMHMTHIPAGGDEKALRRLGVNLTCDPHFATDKLFVS